jgi:hypothetical protein
LYRFKGLLAAGAVALGVTQPAHAWDVITSSAAGTQTVTVWSLNSEIPLSDFLGFGARFRAVGDAVSLLGPFTGPPAGLIDGELRAQTYLNLGELLPLGKLQPVLVPYVGFRALALPEGPLLPTPNLTGINHLLGISYGGQIQLQLPLQLALAVHVGATSFLSGGWARNDSGTWTNGGIDTAGATIPVYGFNLSWGLADWLSLYAGYEWTQLPTNLRGLPTTIGTERTQLGTLKAGLTFPFVSL